MGDQPMFSRRPRGARPPPPSAQPSVSDVLSGLNFNNSQQQYPDQQQQYPHQPFQPQQQMSSRAQINQQYQTPSYGNAGAAFGGQAGGGLPSAPPPPKLSSMANQQQRSGSNQGFYDRQREGNGSNSDQGRDRYGLNSDQRFLEHGSHLGPNSDHRRGRGEGPNFDQRRGGESPNFDQQRRGGEGPNFDQQRRGGESSNFDQQRRGGEGPDFDQQRGRNEANSRDQSYSRDSSFDRKSLNRNYPDDKPIINPWDKPVRNQAINPWDKAPESNTGRPNPWERPPQGMDDMDKDLRPQPGKMQEIVARECRLEFYDANLKLGVLSFFQAKEKHLAFFQQSVFISETIDPLTKQLSVGETYKFHGYLVKPNHPIPYCVSVLWPVNANFQIGFIRPAEDDLTIYSTQVDFIQKKFSSGSRRSWSKGKERSRSRSKGRRSRSRGRRSRSRGRKRSASRGNASLRASKERRGEEVKESSQRRSNIGSPVRKTRNRNLPELKSARHSEEVKKERSRTRSPSSRRISNRPDGMKWTKRKDKPLLIRKDLTPDERARHERNVWVSQSSQKIERSLNLPGLNSKTPDERARHERNANLPELTSKRHNEDVKKESSQRRSRTRSPRRTGGAKQSGARQWTLSPVRTNRAKSRSRSNRRRRERKSRSKSKSNDRRISDIVDAFTPKPVETRLLNMAQPNNGSNQSPMAVIEITDSPQASKKPPLDAVELQIKEAEERLQHKMAELKYLKENGPGGKPLPTSSKKAQLRDYDNENQTFPNQPDFGRRLPMQGGQEPGIRTRGHQSQDSGASHGFGNQEYGGGPPQQTDPQGGNHDGRLLAGGHQDVNYPPVGHRYGQDGQVIQYPLGQQGGQSFSGGNQDGRHVSGEQQNYAWGQPTGGQQPLAGQPKNNDYYDPTEVLDDEPEPVFGKQLSAHREQFQPPSFQEGVAPVLNIEQQEEPVAFGKQLTHDVPVKIAEPVKHKLSKEEKAEMEKKKEELKQKIFSKMHAKKKEKVTPFRRPSVEDEDEVVPLVPPPQTQAQNTWQPVVHTISVAKAPKPGPIDSTMFLGQIQNIDGVDRSKKVQRHPPKPPKPPSPKPPPPPAFIPEVPEPPVISQNTKALLKKLDKNSKKLEAQQKLTVEKQRLLNKSKKVVATDDISKWEKELEERINGKLDNARKKKIGSPDSWSAHDPTYGEYDQGGGYGSLADSGAQYALNALSGVQRDARNVPGDFGRPVVHDVNSMGDRRQSVDNNSTSGQRRVSGEDAGLGQNYKYNSQLTGVDEVMSREIMDNTADAFSMVAPLHQLEFELGDLKVTECADYVPGTRQDVPFAIIGDYNILWMSGLCPATEKDLNIWKNAPLLTISTQAYMKDVKRVMIQTMLRLYKEYMSDSTHFLIFTGYLDAPYMRAEDIFDTFLDIVEDAIRFNLEYNTNFSISFGEVLFPAIERGFDRIILLTNEIARILNHYFLQSESIKKWKLGIEEATSSSTNKLRIVGMNHRVCTEKYNETDPNILSDTSLFKLNKYIRLALSKRYDVMDRIMNNEVDRPRGINKFGREFFLPEPEVPKSREFADMGLCDLLVGRMKRVIALRDVTSGVLESMHPAIPRPTLNLAEMDVSEIKLSQPQSGEQTSAAPPTSSGASLPPPGIAIPAGLGQEARNISVGGFMGDGAKEVKKSRWSVAGPVTGTQSTAFSASIPSFSQSFKTGGGMSYCEYGDLNPALDGVSVKSLVIGDNNALNFASIKPTDKDLRSIWTGDSLYWITCNQGAGISELREVIEYSLERIAYKYKTPDTSFLLYLGCGSLCLTDPGQIFNSLMAIIEDVMIFNLRHQTRFVVTFAESFYSATHRDTDPMVHTHNLVIRIINYYVLCAHNIQLWQETTHNPRQSISDLFKNKLNVLGSKLVVQDNLFEVPEYEQVKDEAIFKLSRLIRARLSNGLVDEEIQMGRMKPPTEVQPYSGNTVRLPCPKKPFGKINWGYLQILKSKCFAKLKYENDPLNNPMPREDECLRLELGYFTPQPIQAQQPTNFKAPTTKSGELDYCAVLDRMADPKTVAPPLPPPQSEQPNVHPVVPPMPNVAVPGGIDCDEVIPEHPLVGKPLHYKQFGGRSSRITESSIFHTSNLISSVNVVVIGDDLVRRMGHIIPKATDSHLWTKQVYLWVASSKQHVKPIGIRLMLNKAMTRTFHTYKSYSTQFILFPSAAELLKLDGGVSPGSPFEKTATVIYHFLLDVIERVIEFNMVNKSDYTVVFTEINYPVDTRELDSQVHNINNIIRLVNHYVIHAISVNFRNHLSKKVGIWKSKKKNGEWNIVDHGGEKYNIEGMTGGMKGPCPDKYLKDFPELPNYETCYDLVYSLRSSVDSGLINHLAVFKGDIPTPKGFNLDGSSYTLEAPKKPKDSLNLSCIQMLENRVSHRLNRMPTDTLPQPIFVPFVFLGPATGDGPLATDGGLSAAAKAASPAVKTAKGSPAVEVATSPAVEANTSSAVEDAGASPAVEDAGASLAGAGWVGEPEDQTEVLCGEEQDFCAEDVEFTHRPGWFKPSLSTPPKFVLIGGGLKGLDSAMPRAEEEKERWKRLPGLIRTVSIPEKLRPKQILLRGYQQEIQATLEYLHGKLGMSGGCPIFVQFPPASSMRLIAATFKDLLSFLEVVMLYNLKEETKFTIIFVESPFLLDHRTYRDRSHFVYNQIVSIVNYHFCESMSPKLWRFTTRYDDQTPNIKMSRVNLNVIEGLNREQAYINFLNFLRDRIDNGLLDREEQPPLGINAQGQIFELPLPVKETSGSFKSVLLQRVNFNTQMGQEVVSLPTLDVKKMTMSKMCMGEPAAQLGLESPEDDDDEDIMILDVEEKKKETITVESDDDEEMLEDPADLLSPTLELEPTASRPKPDVNLSKPSSEASFYYRKPAVTLSEVLMEEPRSNLAEKPEANQEADRTEAIRADSTVEQQSSSQTDPEVEQSEPEVEQTEPDVKQFEPEGEQSKPEVEQSEPEVEQSEPEVEQTKPEGEQSKPEVEQTEPEVEQSKEDPENLPESDLVEDLPESEPKASPASKRGAKASRVRGGRKTVSKGKTAMKAKEKVAVAKAKEKPAAKRSTRSTKK